MHFENVKRVEYVKNILFEVIFQARFPEIMKISREEPADFQDIIRKQGYPESGRNIPDLPQNMPEELTRAFSSDREFFFFSEKKDWQVSLAKNFVALSCKGAYLNYEDFKGRLANVLRTFFDIYEPSYFSRIGLRYQNVVNNSVLPLGGESVRAFIPGYIFPELKKPIANDITTLEKFSQLEDESISVNMSHVFSKLSGKFGQTQINDEESYLIDIDCYSKNKIREVDNVLTRCDSFKEAEYNIFQWSITDPLRERMGPKKGA